MENFINFLAELWNSCSMTSGMTSPFSGKDCLQKFPCRIIGAIWELSFLLHSYKLNKINTSMKSTEPPAEANFCERQTFDDAKV